jgi:hypothetical protein
MVSSVTMNADRGAGVACDQLHRYAQGVPFIEAMLEGAEPGNERSTYECGMLPENLFTA